MENGKSDIFGNAKKLGFGLMRLPMLTGAQKDVIDVEEMKRMVDAFIAAGFTYFDTAWMYCSYHSEDAVKEALTSRYPREAYTLADKLHGKYLASEADRDAIFSEQLRKTGVEFFDYYLLHDMSVERYEIYNRLHCFDWIAGKKAEGRIRHMGFSFHDSADFLDRVLSEHPEMEFVQLQINYLDWDSESVQSGRCYEVARKHGKPVIVMEPVKGGKLARLPESAKKAFLALDEKASMPSYALRFAAGLEGVRMVLSGMSNEKQLLDNISFMSDPKPLSEKEKEAVARAVDIIKNGEEIPCTGCAYCVGGCPMGIDIPKHFAAFNAALAAKREGKVLPVSEIGGGSPADCIACGQCESVCPQHIQVSHKLKLLR